MNIKALIPIFCSVFIGFLLGKVVFNEYDKSSIETFQEGEKVYFVQMGEYKSYNDMISKINDEELDNLLYYSSNDVYYVYSGITKKEKVAERIKEYYKKTSNNVIVVENYITNETFLNILSEYDKITEIATSDKDLISIEKIVISNYKEMVLES